LKSLFRILGRSLLVLLLLLAVGVVLVLFTPVWVHRFGPQEPALQLQADTLRPVPVPPGPLKVMSWNIKFGGGRIDFFFDCYGDRVHMSAREVTTHLAAICRVIRQEDPDILLLQEVDIDSRRAAYVDQLAWILNHTALNYGAYASQWQVRYVPSHGLGRVNSGVAILSKYPLADAVRHQLPLIEEQDPLTRFFYLRRCVLQATVSLPGGAAPIRVLNTHLEAYSHDGTKRRQLQQLAGLAHGASTHGAVIVGGDFNLIPPGARQTHGFDDAACQDEFRADDYRPDARLLMPWYATYAEAIPLQAYLANEPAYYGHTVNGRSSWNRRLDYLFTNGQWAEGRVLQQYFTLSDHAPLVASWQSTGADIAASPVGRHHQAKK
jgi:endonuclease/exonuclease/phosphatase family metal-dependent hydrolase